MYTRFYDNTIETKFIKALVAGTYIPTVGVWTPGKFVVKGLNYITPSHILKCNFSGTPKGLDSFAKTEEGKTIPYLTKVSTYLPNKSYLNINNSYVSSVSGYDPTTHYYLGQYLRSLRDLYNIDLMSFYNCFNDVYITNFSFDSTGSIIPAENNYKILSVPVKYGQTYTVAVDSGMPISLMTVIYGQKGLLTERTEDLNNKNGSTSMVVEQSSFTSPFTYKTPEWESVVTTKTKTVNEETDDLTLGQYERFLRLLIKVPYGNKSSVVVLEGDYRLNENVQQYIAFQGSSTRIARKIRAASGVVNNTNLCSNTNLVTTFANGAGKPVSPMGNVSFINNTLTYNSKLVTGAFARPALIKTDGTGPDNPGKQIIQEEWLSPLGLLQLSDGYIYAFSNRLIEYLLLNVITPIDEIDQNTVRIQEYASSRINLEKNGSRYTSSYVPGVWEDSLRLYLYNLVKDTKYLSGKPKVDFNGFVDKDTEQIVTRGQKI